MPKVEEMAEECILDGFPKLRTVGADQLDSSQCGFYCVVFFWFSWAQHRGTEKTLISVWLSLLYCLLFKYLVFSWYFFFFFIINISSGLTHWIFSHYICVPSSASAWLADNPISWEHIRHKTSDLHWGRDPVKEPLISDNNSPAFVQTYFWLCATSPCVCYILWIYWPCVFLTVSGKFWLLFTWKIIIWSWLDVYRNCVVLKLCYLLFFNIYYTVIIWPIWLIETVQFLLFKAWLESLAQFFIQLVCTSRKFWLQTSQGGQDKMRARRWQDASHT